MNASSKTAVLFLLYFVSSSSLLVLNKVAITAIPNASLLLFVQLSSTVVLMLASSLLGKSQIKYKQSMTYMWAYSTVATVFLATIYSNFRVIHSIGVNPFIVLKCSTPLLVSVLDWTFMGRTLPDWKSTLALFGILCSSSIYARLKITDPSFSVSTDVDTDTAVGLFWSMTWLISFCLDMVYVKYVVEKYPCSSSERTLYQNFLALPFLAVLLIGGIEEHNVGEASQASQSAHIAVLLTCFAGAALSFSGMALRTELSATMFTILGIVSKMASTLLNEIFVEPERDLSRLFCIAGVIFSSSFYGQAPLKNVS